MSKIFLCTVIFYCLISPITSIVKLKSASNSFPDAPARFGKELHGGSICGVLHLADPLDACSSLHNQLEYAGDDDNNVTIVLIVRGKCAFDEKVKNAQDAGFQGAIVYEDRQNRNLIAMLGNPDGIQIPSVFVLKEVGETLRNHTLEECCIFSIIQESAWTVMVISFISIFAVLSLLATVSFYYKYSRNRQWAKKLVIDHKFVDNLPSITFGSNNTNSSVGETCAICLEDYKNGESVKVLTCKHDFHSACVSSWLTKWATSCPVCKHDIRTKLSSSIK